MFLIEKLCPEFLESKTQLTYYSENLGLFRVLGLNTYKNMSYLGKCTPLVFRSTKYKISNLSYTCIVYPLKSLSKHLLGLLED